MVHCAKMNANQEPDFVYIVPSRTKHFEHGARIEVVRIAE